MTEEDITWWNLPRYTKDYRDGVKLYMKKVMANFAREDEIKSPYHPNHKRGFDKRRFNAEVEVATSAHVLTGREVKEILDGYENSFGGYIKKKRKSKSGRDNNLGKDTWIIGDRMEIDSVKVQLHPEGEFMKPSKDPKTVMFEEAQTPIKPTKTEETPKTQIHNRYETIRVPILKPSEYPIWKVRMCMFLEATDLEYLDRINEGPHKTTKLSVIVADQPAQTVPKEKSQ
ncbi:hypothetical protein AgCh_001202 [Apium graveolens]